MKQTITGVQYAAMIISGAAAIENARQTINELNVFPVPDGDTGINMSLTMNTAVDDIKSMPQYEVGHTAEIVAGGLLRGARGNSGVILALLFRGFANHLKSAVTINGADFANALADGVDEAYRAVIKPIEGTILTVSRVCAIQGKRAAKENCSIENVLEAIVHTANAELIKTTEQNPILERAGVVDAGAMGFCVILEGMLAALRNTPVSLDTERKFTPRSQVNFSEYKAEDIRFSYCTELVILHRSAKKSSDKLQTLLDDVGDSLIFVDDGDMIKIHIHTNNPDYVIEESRAYGKLTGIKIENMREQHTEKVFGLKNTAVSVIAAPETQYGFVAVASGIGIITLLRDLGVNHIVEGGQTMNPSMNDILHYISLTPSEIVFILPNNKNIIMAAEQCASLTEKTIIVLPTQNIPQAISALLAFDLESEPEINREAMIQAMNRVIAGEITYAARDSQLDGITINKGDYIAFLEGKFLAAYKNIDDTLGILAKEINKKRPSSLTVFYGEDIAEETVGATVKLLESYCSSVEVSLLYGGQPVYYYLIFAEQTTL